MSHNGSREQVIQVTITSSKPTAMPGNSVSICRLMFPLEGKVKNEDKRKENPPCNMTASFFLSVILPSLSHR